MKTLAKNIKHGLTLVELQIVIAIFAAITFVVGGIYFTYTRMFGEERANIQVASENKNAIDEITNQIREAVAVSTNCSICPVSSSSPQVLILTLWPLDSLGNLSPPAGNNYDYVLYRLDGANSVNLQKIIIPNGIGSTRIATTKILASTIKTLSFEYNDSQNIANSTEITINLTTETKSSTKIHTFSQTSKANIRNK